MNWRWINKQALLLHDESLVEHGGSSGMRDKNLLDSALAHPQNLAVYTNPDHAALTASYGMGIARNHPFIDGNKRAALFATGLFLYLKGYRLTSGQAETTLTMLAVAAGEIDEETFARWLREHLSAR